jgi:hypothetical protein
MINNVKTTAKNVGLALLVQHLAIGCSPTELKETYKDPNIIRIDFDVPLVKNSEQGTYFMNTDGEPGYNILGSKLTNQSIRYVDTNSVNYDKTKYPYASNWKDVHIGDKTKQNLIDLEKTLKELQKNLYNDAKNAGL